MRHSLKPSLRRIYAVRVFLLAFGATSSIAGAEGNEVKLRGELGNASADCSARFYFTPFNSLSWLRADLTGEQATEHDEAGSGHLMKRPFVKALVWLDTRSMSGSGTSPFSQYLPGAVALGKL
ncbi:hypothetical protein DDZ13_07610 [Coraliomargarita sinensis]|uniref:Uncharacterized protein n=1 Tax=Coraliomargarita sinensis TaxID=2174842 RepID=A0A317ZG44_9BACT|nr:hypothetical protein [Coraliomargarita sinensis]PXA04390.1 hypothetical protein DDZ13_07610 [Coraliomargarita sinensis]